MSAALMALVAAGCGRGAGGNPAETRPGSGEKRAEGGPASRPAGLNGFAAMGYFADHCARCHGPEGIGYGPTFGQHLSAAALRDKIEAMAIGPGGAPLEAAELDEMVVYHQSLITQVPFVDVVAVETKGDKVMVSGEVSSDAEVEVRCSAARVRAVVDGNTWRAEVSRLGKDAAGEVVARKDGKEAVAAWREQP